MVGYAGQLLVAAPRLADPNFFRAVILLLDHDDDGAVGVVVNRPSQLPLHAVLPAWANSAAEPALLFTGGPVAPESALAVAASLGDQPPVGFQRLVDHLGLIDLDQDPGSVVPAVQGFRVFSGYAGWGAGQLEAEVAEGSWYVVSASTTDLLAPRPTGLWRSVLRRQPGELAFVATYPLDPSMN